MAVLLSRIDDAVARVERVVVIIGLVVMTSAVFLDVVYRLTATRTTAELVRWLPLVFGFYLLAMRTATGAPSSWKRSLAGTAALTALTCAAIFLLLRVFPNGLVWSQPLALSIMLWVAMLGATLATKERAHIAIEAAGKLWPAASQRYVRATSGLVAATFCGMLAILGGNYMQDYFVQWRDFGGGRVEGVGIPLWTTFTALPVCFTLMALRFLGHAAGDLTGSETAAEGSAS